MRAEGSVTGCRRRGSSWGVLVGRHDVLPPESEAEVDAVVKRLQGDSNAEAKAADATLNKLGRYRWARPIGGGEAVEGGVATRAGR